MDEQIITMYAKGMSTRDIEAFINNLYGVSISPDYVSPVTDRVLEDVREWQNHPLESVYPVAFFEGPPSQNPQWRLREEHGRSSWDWRANGRYA